MQQNKSIVVKKHNVSYGNLGLNGFLGYENKKVYLTEIGENITYISAHSNSTLMVQLNKEMKVFGAINNDVDTIHFQMFMVDGEMIGALNRGNQKTAPIKIKPGLHAFQIITTDSDSGHTIWGFSENVSDFKIRNGVHPGIEIITNAICGRKCPGCNQHYFMTNNKNYSFKVSDAQKLVDALQKYDRTYNLIFSGGEPALWTEMDDVMSVFNHCDKVARTQLTSSCYDEDYIKKVHDLFDIVCISVRNDRPDILTNPPEYFCGITRWDARRHRTGNMAYQGKIDCSCMHCGVTTAMIGDKIYPCTLASDLFHQKKWFSLNPIPVDDFISGRKTFEPMGTYNQCHECVNNRSSSCDKTERT